METRPELEAGGVAAAARESQFAALARYTLILDNMTEGVSLATEDGTIVYTNRAEDEMFGYGPGELIGRHVSTQNAYPASENDARVSQVMATLRSSGHWQGDWHNRRKDGSTFATASRITAVALEGRTHWLCVQRDVTAERAAAAAHLEVEERLQLAIEGTGAGIYDIDLATDVGIWSPQMFAILGYPPSPDGRAMAKMMLDRVHPDDAARVAATRGRVVARGGTLRMDFRILKVGSGETRWLSVHGRVLRDAEGGARSIGTVLDVTERHLIEASAREGEARLQVAMEAGQLGSWWFDVEQGCGGWSEYSARMLGVSAQGRSVSYQEWLDIVYPSDRAGAEAAFAAALAGETARYDVEYRVVHPNGAVRRLHAVGAVERRRAGRASRVVGTFRDVTDERAASETLAETATRLDLAVSAHAIGIFDWYVPTGTVVWSAQEEALFGLAPGSFGGSIEAWAARLVAEDAAALQAKLERAMAAREERLDFAFRIHRPDGAIRWIEGAGHVLYGPDGVPLRVVGTSMDVTERREAEEHQQLLVNELNHRVKNILAIVQGIAHQSFRGANVPLDNRVAFEGRLAALSAAHTLLTRESWEAAPIAEVVADAVAPLAAGRIAASGPDLRLPPKLAVSLALVIHELCTNAAKYGALSTGDGQVEVRWTVELGRLAFEWRERRGPPVRPPARRGFGTKLIERALASEFGGTATIAFDPEGVLCTLSAPLPE